MRTLLLLGLTLVIACGGRQEPKCFECGLSDERAQAEAEERERANAVAAPEPEPVPVVEEPEQHRGCGFPATEEVPYPCRERYQAEDQFLVVPKPMALRGLSIKAPVLDGYSRKDWKHWTDEDHDCQDTRQEVLIEESEVPVTFKTERKCKVLTGRWTCPYTGEVFTNPRKLDVNHMVPLGAAHAAGGHAWDAERRRAFANELEVAHHLIAVKASANRSKGKRGPEDWLPPNESYVCDYVMTWIDIKARWGLAMSAAEQAVLDQQVSRCR